MSLQFFENFLWGFGCENRHGGPIFEESDVAVIYDLVHRAILRCFTDTSPEVLTLHVVNAVKAHMRSILQHMTPAFKLRKVALLSAHRIYRPQVVAILLQD